MPLIVSHNPNAVCVSCKQYLSSPLIVSHDPSSFSRQIFPSNDLSPLSDDNDADDAFGNGPSPEAVNVDNLLSDERYYTSPGQLWHEKFDWWRTTENGTRFDLHFLSTTYRSMWCLQKRCA